MMDSAVLHADTIIPRPKDRGPIEAIADDGGNTANYGRCPRGQRGLKHHLRGLGGRAAGSLPPYPPFFGSRRWKC